jgi:hypothetical protein
MLTLVALTMALAQFGGKPAPLPESDVRGTAGICIRWGEDSNHVAEAVVVSSTGNPALDAALPATVRRMTWKRPARDIGAWMGIYMAVGGYPTPVGFPECSHLPTPAKRSSPQSS